MPASDPNPAPPPPQQPPPAATSGGPARRATGRLRGLAVDLGPLRSSRDYRLLFSGQLVSLVGQQITVVALPFQVYELTGSALAVGVLGLAQVVPLAGVFLFAGVIADSFDRRLLLAAANSGLALCSALLVGGALLGHPPLVALYAVAALQAGLIALELTARQSSIPRMVAADQLSGAIALNFAQIQATLVAGPALGGLVIAHLGLAAAYLIDVGTFAAVLVACAALSPLPPPSGGREPPLRAIAEGWRFAREHRVLLGTFAVDLAAMVGGMPRAVFPALAQATYGVGPSGLGLLYAAPGVGAVAAALSTGWVGRISRQGVAVVVAVSVWGLAIIGVGLAPSFALGLLLLVVAGAGDSVSAVCRGIILQTVTPDQLRGRMTATFGMVVRGGPYLGDLEAGAVAGAFTPQVSVVSGGALALAGLAATAVAFPELLAYRARRPAAPR